MNIEFNVTGDEPVELPMLKTFMRIDYDDADNLIRMLARAARGAIERYCGISIVEKEITLTYNSMRPNFQIPYGPVKSIESITINDEVVDEPTDGWVRYGPGNLEMTYTAGYDPVPDELCTAIMILTEMYHDKKAVVGAVPDSVKMLIEPYNRNTFI